MQTTISKADAIQHLTTSLEGLAPLRKAVIPVFLADAVGLEIPDSKKDKPKALVKYFVSDIFDKCEVDPNVERIVDENFFDREEKRLLEAISDTPPGEKRDSYKIELVELREKFSQAGDITETPEDESE